MEVLHVAFGGEEPVLIAGPCSVESESMILETAAAVAAAGGDMLRGGAYKPRTSPYDFQGLGSRDSGIWPTPVSEPACRS